MNHFKPLRKYFWKYRFRLAGGIFFIIISNYFSALPPQVTSFVVNKVQNIIDGHASAPVKYETDVVVNTFISWVNSLITWSSSGIVALCGLLILVMALLRGIFMFLMRQTIIVMSRHIEYDQKNEVYHHYQKLDTQFYKTHSTGDLMNRVAEDVSRVRMYTGPAIMYLINLLTTLFFCIGNMLATDVKLTLYVLAPLPFLALTIYLANTIIHRKSEKIQSLLSDLTTNAQQSYSGIRVIKSYVQEKAMNGFFNSNSEAYKKNAVSLAKVEAVYFPAMTLMIGLSTLLTIMIGGIAYHGTDKVGVIVKFVLYINMLTFPVSAIGWVASMTQRASASQKRINEFLHMQPAIRSAVAGESALLKGHIRFSHVFFTYPHTGIKALQNFTLDIPAGARVAIIGKTGSGKSTVAQLLLRMYDADTGTITIDEKPLATFNLQHLRRQISYVPQDVFLFSDTVANNIKFGNAAATQEAVVQSARMASVEGEIRSFENSYETVIGERGVTLSGGQKQRLSIARALLKESPVIIFDDCLSAVDARTEKEVLKNLDEQLLGKTAIIITHRIFTLLQFDTIVVMDEGRIIEQGTHDYLLNLNGAYTELYQLQQEKEVEAN